MDQRIRSSRSASIRLPGAAAVQQVASVQPHQELTARVPARRKRSSSGVLMCRKGTLRESPSTNLSGVDGFQQGGQSVDTPPTRPPTRETSARAARAKVMEERRRELEQGISQAQTKSRQRSAGKAAETLKTGATSGRGQDTVGKRKRSKSSRSIGEVRCRNKPDSPASQVNSTNEVVSSIAAGEDQLESTLTGCLVASQDSALLVEQENAEDVLQELEGSKVDPKEVDVRESNGAGGSLMLEPAEVKIGEGDLAESLEEAISKVVDTEEVTIEESAALDLATSQKGIAREDESSNQAEVNREQGIKEVVEHGEQLQQPSEDLEQQPVGVCVSPMQHKLADDEDEEVEQKPVSKVIKKKEELPIPTLDVFEEMRSTKSNSPMSQARTKKKTKQGSSRVLLENKSKFGDEASTSRVRQGKNVGLKEMPRTQGFGKYKSIRVSMSPTLGDISEVSARGFKKRRASSALKAGGEKGRKLALNLDKDKATNESGARGDQGENSNSLTISCGSECQGDVEEERELQAGGDYVKLGEEDEMRVGDVCREQEITICPTETPEKLPGREQEINVCPSEAPESFPELIIAPNVVQLSDCGDKIVDEENMVAEADNEVVNTGDEGRKGFESRNNSSNCNGRVDSGGRDASKGQRVARLAQDWSDEELENSGKENLGEMRDKEALISIRGVEVGEVDRAVDRGQKRDAGDSEKRECGKGEVGENVSLKKKGAEKRKKKVQSWRRKPEATEQFDMLSEADGSRKAGSEVGNKKKRLLGSKIMMLEDSPVMADAPTFDTTLPAFEEAHNTSKRQKSFQEAPPGMNSLNQDKFLGESSRQDISHENALHVRDRSSAVPLPEPSIRSDRKAVDAEAKKSKLGQSRRNVKVDNRNKASVGTKRKAEMKNNGGRQRKAPRRTITHLDFPNYDHLKIIPRKPEDVTQSFYDVSNLSEVSKSRKFFKQSPIPEEYKRKYTNKTSMLNLAASFKSRSGVVSKRRSSVDVSAIASITLPHETRAQINDWDFGNEETEGRASRVQRLASASKSSRPTMVEVSTLTDQGLVTMTVEEFNQVLQLVASGIQLACANTEGAAVQEQKTVLLRELKQKITSM